MTDQTRRAVLKTLAYGTVLSTGVASSLAFAGATKPSDASFNNTPDSSLNRSGLTDSSGITIFQQGAGYEQTVTLMNLSDKPVCLHQMAPISIENINGSSRIKVNTVKQSDVILEAGQRISFQLSNPSPELASIASEHPAFNGSVLSC